ncbi:MAG: lysophospholipid acyltransferase family protein, partial [Candidatus Aureabacteria bacterium]|nr:lysophospholipid acyltransferase family protein [Candidatus Auribacterota bacterium]
KIIYFSLLHFLALHLPRKMSYAIAWFIANLNFIFNRTSRRGVISNLAVIMEFKGKDPTSVSTRGEIKRIARRTFVNFGKYLVDFFAAGSLTRDFINRRIKIDSLEALDKTIKDKKGSIIVSAHLGNWELGAIVLALLDYPINVVVLPHKNEKIDRLFVEKRTSKNVRVIPIGYALRRCFEALRKNEIVAVLGDRDTTSNGEIHEFFGKKCILPKGPVDIALRTGCNIVFGFFVRTSYDKYLFEIDGPLEVNKDNISRDELWGKIIGKMEGLILKYPDQWFVFYPLWS